MENYSMICRAGETSGESFSYQSLPFGKSRIRVLTFDGTPPHRKTSTVCPIHQKSPHIAKGVK